MQRDFWSVVQTCCSEPLVIPHGPGSPSSLPHDPATEGLTPDAAGGLWDPFGAGG